MRTAPRPAGASRRGLTLIEILISYTLLAVVLALVLAVVLTSSRSVTDASVRSYNTAKGHDALARMTRDLQMVNLDLTEGAATFCLGTLVAVGPPYDFQGLAADDPPGSGVYEGRAVRFRLVTGYEANPTPPATEGPILTPASPQPELVYAFVADEAQNGADDDRDGLVDELRLVRIEENSTGTDNLVLVVDLVTNVENTATSPTFTLTRPSELEVTFTVRQQVDYDHQRQEGVFVDVEFTRTINCRNMNQN